MPRASPTRARLPGRSGPGLDPQPGANNKASETGLQTTARRRAGPLRRRRQRLANRHGDRRGNLQGRGRLSGLHRRGLPRRRERLLDQDLAVTAPVVTPPITLEGSGPGGNITGMAFIEDSTGTEHLFAVSDSAGSTKSITTVRSASSKCRTTPRRHRGHRRRRHVELFGHHQRQLIFRLRGAGRVRGSHGRTAGRRERGLLRDALRDQRVRRCCTPWPPSSTPTARPSASRSRRFSWTGRRASTRAWASPTAWPSARWTTTSGTSPTSGRPTSATRSCPPTTGPAAPCQSPADDEFLLRPGESDHGHFLSARAGNYGDTNPTVYSTFDLPDGADGSLTTQPFSLADYTAGDGPTLYFDYLLSDSGSARLRRWSPPPATGPPGCNWPTWPTPSPSPTPINGCKANTAWRILRATAASA